MPSVPAARAGMTAGTAAFVVTIARLRNEGRHCELKFSDTRRTSLRCHDPLSWLHSQNCAQSRWENGF
jgi:hypothetical protein